VVSTLAGIEIIRVMATVLLIGLALDIMNTWITNASILKWYVEGKVS
jgi:preprotein translocase subunit SecF